MLNDFENNLNRDVSIKIDGSPNGSLLIADWCGKHYLDNKRHLLNLGSFTGRDLEWMLPICKKYSKQIECIENWHFISSTSVRNKIIEEIIHSRSDELVTWTWKDAEEAESLWSADFFCIFTTWNQFDLHNHIKSVNHPSIWMLNSGSLSWGLNILSSLITQEKLFYMYSSPEIYLFSNDISVRDKFLYDFEKLLPSLKKYNQYLELCGDHVRWRKKGVAGDVKLYEFIKNLESNT